MSFFDNNKKTGEDIQNFVSNHNNSSNKRDSTSDLSSTTTTNTTDYESARSEIVQSEQEDEDEDEEEAAEPEQTYHGDDDDTRSISTIKDQNHTQEAIIDQNNELNSNKLVNTQETIDDIPQEHVLEQHNIDPSIINSELHKTKTNQSKFRDSNLVAPTQQFDPAQTESEAFELALTRTLSRKSQLQKLSSRTESNKEANKEFQSSASSSEDEGIDPATLEWDSPTDPENPKNWSNFRKWFVTMTTALICLVVTFGSSLYVTGVPDLVVKLGVSEELAISGLTFYLLGLAFGPALAAPISELAGRRIVYIISLPVSMLFTMGIVLAKNIRTILVLRFFSGFFASPAMAVAGGTVADMWDYEMIGIAMSGFCLSPFMGPVLGPVISSFAAEKKGWRWPMYINLIFAGLVLVPVLFSPETYKPILLKKRALKRGIKLKVNNIPASKKLELLFTITLATPMKMLIVEPIVMVFSIYAAFVFAVLFGFFEAYPIIFRGVYKMSIGISGLTFIGIMIGFFLGILLYVVVDRFKFFAKNADGTRGKRDDQGRLIIDAPESRLILMKIGAVALPPSLFWLGWSSKPSVHWISSVIAGVPFGFGLLLVFFTTMLYFSMSYPPLSLASALAANNLLRYILASVFPLFTVQMYDKLGVDWASSLFAFIAVALVPVPWIFEKWGPRLRLSSTYGYAAMMKKESQEDAELEGSDDV
ncbi:hypothetical protein WICMUC_001702 [Wickerhamomyces mucosus]|uniref:Major facilitator superfamily (MFS) profile domain-containing protein n=1 Tax=Wickerhamomyces mucosus TaxID=1378264 RepID=A0A9P8TFY4_9ASCO|nr:hypothetical protein WICMUC_001702 [Wickerhamomyces mucosus]